VTKLEGKRMKTCSRRIFLSLLSSVAVLSGGAAESARAETPGAQAPPGSQAPVAEIAEEAFVYGFPLVMNYGVMYQFAIDGSSPLFKAHFNQIYNEARVYTPEDTAVVTPNSDTPYSYVWMDLRAEPVVLSVPEVEKSRYYSVQLFDLYTFTPGYIGSRATGNHAGNYLIAGPDWKGETPPGIDKVFPCETQFALALIRTQLFGPGDIEKVRKIQQGYKVRTLSGFLGGPAPPAAAPIEWPKIDTASAEANPFAYLSFILQFAPPTGPAEVEAPMRARFARIGIEAGKPFAVDTLTASQKAELATGAKSGMEKIKGRVATFGENKNGWLINTNPQVGGDRDAYQGDWVMRAAVAAAGIYGNQAVEAIYPILAADSDGNKLDGSKGRYALTFAADQLPPVHSFWSITMYDGRSQLLIENPIDRYLINSPMLPNLKRNADGSVTIDMQKDSPGPDKESNWLPAPDGPIYAVMRLYWPKEEALGGRWKPPAVQRIE
jgi:hypothetical protein